MKQIVDAFPGAAEKLPDWTQSSPSIGVSTQPVRWTTEGIPKQH